MFYVLLLKQDITKMRQIDKNAIKLDANGNNKEYKVKAIWDSAVYLNKLAKDHLLKFYCLIF